jgi:hypothetical protein
MKNYEQLKDLIKKDIDIFLWISFEEMTRQILIQENLKQKLPFNIEKIWYFYDKKWQNEIDLVCVNSKEKKVLFIECKINSRNINISELEKLKQKVKDSGIYYSYKKYYWFSSVDKFDLNCDYKISIEEIIKSIN